MDTTTADSNTRLYNTSDFLAKVIAHRKKSEYLSSKERVVMAINHQETDRVPIDFWAASEVKADLSKHFNCDYDEFLEIIGADLRVVQGPSFAGLKMHTYDDGTYTDLWGVRRKRVSYGVGNRKGTYEEVAESPLALMTSVDEIESYKGWPSPDWWDYSQIADLCRINNGKCVVYAGDRLDRTAQLKTAMYLRGVKQIFIDLARSPIIVECMLEHINAYYLEYNRRVFQAAEDEIDIFMMGDDFGTQTGLMMSVEMWERFFEPGFRAFIELAHEYGLKVMHHSCGAVGPLIPKFIDAGLDILQSLQPRAAGMDLMRLKEEYGKELAFHGSVDIQQTMPFGTPQDIRHEVKHRLDVGKSGGGFIICTSHNLQRDVPIDNIISLIEAYHEFGAYD